MIDARWSILELGLDFREKSAFLTMNPIKKRGKKRRLRLPFPFDLQGFGGRGQEENSSKKRTFFDRVGHAPEWIMTNLINFLPTSTKLNPSRHLINPNDENDPVIALSSKPDNRGRGTNWKKTIPPENLHWHIGIAEL